MVLAATLNDSLDWVFSGPYTDGLTISQNYFFKQWYSKRSTGFKENMIFMQETDPLHASKG